MKRGKASAGGQLSEQDREKVFSLFSAIRRIKGNVQRRRVEAAQ